jgi:hypothetical protein
MAKTIFTAGRAVTASWLNSSQYLGPSNPGVVFVANPINDFEYPLLKASSLDLPNLFGYFVGTTSDQNVDGEKTFLISPRVPTATNSSGTQVVNIDRLNTDLNGVTSTTTSLITSLATDLSTNYVKIAETQTITGSKKFDSITVPLLPSSSDAPISSNYFNTNAVLRYNDQIIDGLKTFNVCPQVPNPDSSLDAVNYQTLLSSIAQIVNPQVSSGCLKFGAIQIVFGSTVISGNWSGAVLGTGASTYSTYAASASPFQTIVGGGAAINRRVALESNFDINGIAFQATEIGSDPQPANGLIRWVVFGYI